MRRREFIAHQKPFAAGSQRRRQNIPISSAPNPCTMMAGGSS
jgi:hypothetical protein